MSEMDGEAEVCVMLTNNIEMSFEISYSTSDGTAQCKSLFCRAGPYIMAIVVPCTIESTLLKPIVIITHCVTVDTFLRGQ